MLDERGPNASARSMKFEPELRAGADFFSWGPCFKNSFSVSKKKKKKRKETEKRQKRRDLASRDKYEKERKGERRDRSC